MVQIDIPGIGTIGSPDAPPASAPVSSEFQNSGDPMLDQAGQDVADYLNGKGDPQRARTALEYINAATKQAPTGETSDQKLAREQALQQARQQYQAQRDQTRAQDQSALQAQRDQAAGSRQDARDQAASQRQDAREAAAASRQDAGDTTRLAIAGGNNATSRANAQTAADSRVDVAGVAGQSRVDVANINAAARIKAINDRTAGQLAQLDQKFEQSLQTLNANEALKKDYYAFTNQLQIVRDEHLQQAMAVRQQANMELQQEYERPYKEAQARAEQERADTERQRANTEQQTALNSQRYQQQNQQQNLRLQQANMQLGLAKEQSGMATEAINSGVKLGVAPPMALVKAQFAPFEMAQQVLQGLIDSGTIDASRVPAGLPGVSASQAQGGMTAPAPQQANDNSDWSMAPPPVGVGV